jgi:hypothetical protein
MLYAFTGFEKDEEYSSLMTTRKLPIPKDVPVQCPEEYYSTILQCWHRNPDRRLTFGFLADFLYDFENAIESAYMGNFSTYFVQHEVTKLSCRLGFHFGFHRSCVILNGNILQAKDLFINAHEILN